MKFPKRSTQRTENAKPRETDENETRHEKTQRETTRQYTTAHGIAVHHRHSTPQYIPSSMQLEDKITHAYFSDVPVAIAATRTTLFTAADKSIKVFNLQSSSREPEVINTLATVKSISTRVNPGSELCHALVAGGFDCAWHDLSEFIIKDNGDGGSGNSVNDLQPGTGLMRQLWKSSSSISQAIFTHGGQRACIGDLAANLVLVDVSKPDDDNSFGKVIEKVKVAGEITGLAYSYSVDLLAVTVADGGLSIYSLSSNTPERKAVVGNIMVDKRIALTHEMGLADDDSDSEFSENGFDNDDDDDEDSMLTETTGHGGGGKSGRNKKNNILKYASSKTVWNPSGDVLAVPNKNLNIDFYNVINWGAPLNSLFAGAPFHHREPISGLAFSPNGELLASISLDKVLIIWDIKTRKMMARTSLPFIGIDITWSDDTSIIISSNKGKVLNIDKATFNQLLKQRTQKGVTINEKATTMNGDDDSDDMGDDVMDSDDDENQLEMDLDRPLSQDRDGFVVDENGHIEMYADDDDLDADSNRRRRLDTASESTELTDFSKRQRRENAMSGGGRGGSAGTIGISLKSGWGKALTRPFSAGQTPWDGSDRRYLTITPVGCVYTVKVQKTFKITVLFFDEEQHRKYFFDDLLGYDICSINDQGAVFATSGFRAEKNYIARVEFKDHSNGKMGETQWIREIALRPYEFITSVSVHGNHIFVATNKGFLRKYNLHGRIMDMMMMDCTVAIMNNDNYVFSIVKKSIESGYFFNIQNIDGELIQQELGIPLITENDLGDNMNEIPIKNMFFSAEGEPCIVRNDNILMALTRWRNPASKPNWKPLLDVQEGVLRSGRGRELKAWPLGLFGDSFLFVPFRGSKKYPIFPLLTPMSVDIKIPLNYVDPESRENERLAREDGDSDVDGDGNNLNNELFGENGSETTAAAENPEEKFLRTIALAEMLNDAVANDDVGDNDTIEKLQLLSLEYDKTLLIQIDDACSSGDTDDAFELCKMIRDFRALNAAQRLAEAKGMAGLARRIRNLREAKIAEEEEELVEGALNVDEEDEAY